MSTWSVRGSNSRVVVTSEPDAIRGAKAYASFVNDVMFRRNDAGTMSFPMVFSLSVTGLVDAFLDAVRPDCPSVVAHEAREAIQHREQAQEPHRYEEALPMLIKGVIVDRPLHVCDVHGLR